MSHLKAIIVLVAGFLAACTVGTQDTSRQEYNPSASYPFGRANPNAPPELAQFDFIVGHNNCNEERLNSATGEWVAGERSWDGHYTLNGYGVWDSGTSGSSTNGNIRTFDPVSGKWYVTFVATPAYSTGTWSGNRVGNSIVLERPQKAPGTDIDGINRLTFYDVTDVSFSWKGEWASLDNSIVNEFWRLDCRKVSR